MSEILSTDLNTDGILRLTLNDNARRNALSEAMLAALTDQIAKATERADVRVVVLAAQGPAFSAGHDLKELSAHRTGPDGGRDYFTHIMNSCSNLMTEIVACSKPVIAEVSGVATAAGCQLVASCDLAVAAQSARFSTPGVHIGLFCSTPMVALSRNISRKHAMEMLLTGDMVSAERACEIGLVNRVVPEAELTSETMKLAQQVASKSSHTIAIGKRAFYEQAQMDLSQAYAYASQVMVENMLTRDAQEGIGAFTEKRKPKWQDS